MAHAWLAAWFDQDTAEPSQGTWVEQSTIHVIPLKVLVECVQVQEGAALREWLEEE